MVRKVLVYGSLNNESFKDVPPNGKTVYLTFDDGPGAYTQEVLNHLDRYGVKATFFVTNQFTRYQNLLKTLADSGYQVRLARTRRMHYTGAVCSLKSPHHLLVSRLVML
jgi:peptidoglycan/xylan/chitin deacetylase (PgdA/CDA1 family)